MLQLKVIQIIQETEDVKTYLFQNIDNQRIIYKAGQFLTLIFNINGEEIRRSYSLNSAPNVDATLAISVKRIPNGAVSRYLHDHVHAGDYKIFDAEILRGVTLSCIAYADSEAVEIVVN